MNDKVKHFIAGVGIAIIMLVFFIFVHVPYNWDKGIVFAVVAIVAIGKEVIWDKWLHRGEPDLYDALATIYGGWGTVFLWGIAELFI